MPRFKPIQSTDEIKASNDWTDSTKFISKGRIVGENGKPQLSDYQGRQYRLISKKERPFSRCERVRRGFLGGLAVACSLGIALACKSIRKLFTENLAKIRFGIPVVPPTNTHTNNFNEQDIPKITSEIKSHMGEILNKNKKGDGLTFYPSRNNIIFSLDSLPEYIFKMACGLSSATRRYNQIDSAREICRRHQLGLLVIPEARLLSVTHNNRYYTILAEKKLEIDKSEYTQEKYFEEYADSLNEAVRQLAVLICLTGYSDVEQRNNPVLHNSLNEFGQRQLALIDLEHMRDAERGLFGGLSNGLVRCVTKTQANIVRKVAKQHRISTSDFKRALETRKRNLEYNQKLKEYHTKRGIKTGAELIQPDIETLGLDLNEIATIKQKVKDKNGRRIMTDDGDFAYEEKTMSLRDFTNILIEEINKSIQEKPDTDPPKGKRHIVLCVDRDPLEDFERAGSAGYRFIPNEEQAKKEYWIPRILTALLEKGYLFKIIEMWDPYIIQA